LAVDNGSAGETVQIPFGKPSFGDEEIAAVTAVLRSGWIGMGPETLAFEQELAACLHAPHVVTVSSCTGALFLALSVSGIGPGDDVVCPSLTWCSTANAALYLGARSVFCDVAASDGLASPETILAAVTPATKAVVVVHYGGRAMDVRGLRQVLPDHVVIIEDFAHALGASYPDGTPVGSSGNLCCFSFYANKNLSTAEGGAVALADPDVAARLASLRQHGLQANAWGRYSRPETSASAFALTELGYKLNYTDLQAAIGRVQLRRQGAFAAHRLDVARLYARRLAEAAPEVRLLDGVLEQSHARHLIVAELPARYRQAGRDAIVARLRQAGLGLSIHFPPLHLMPLYGPGRHLPVTEDLAARIVTLPVGAAITLAEAETCVGALIDALG
jgi:perosamine synthetase